MTNSLYFLGNVLVLVDLRTDCCDVSSASRAGSSRDNSRTCFDSLLSFKISSPTFSTLSNGEPEEEDDVVKGCFTYWSRTWIPPSRFGRSLSHSWYNVLEWNLSRRASCLSTVIGALSNSRNITSLETINFMLLHHTVYKLLKY